MTQVAYNSDASEPFGNFAGFTPSGAPPRARPPLPAGVESRRRGGAGGPGRRPRRPLRTAFRRAGHEATTPGSGAPPGGDPPHGSRRAQPDREGVTVAELRSFIFLDRLQPQTMCMSRYLVSGQPAAAATSPPRSSRSRRTRHRAADRRRAQARRGAAPASWSSSGSSAISRFTAADRRGEGRRQPRCSTRSAPAPGTRHAPQVLASKIITMLDAQHAVPDQPQQAWLDGTPGRVAVRPRDAAGLLRDPRHQRGREGGPYQGRRLPDDRRHRPRLPAGREANLRQAAGAAESRSSRASMSDLSSRQRLRLRALVARLLRAICCPGWRTAGQGAGTHVTVRHGGRPRPARSSAAGRDGRCCAPSADLAGIREPAVCICSRTPRRARTCGRGGPVAAFAPVAAPVRSGRCTGSRRGRSPRRLVREAARSGAKIVLGPHAVADAARRATGRRRGRPESRRSADDARPRSSATCGPRGGSKEIPNGAFLEVELEGSGSRLVAFDVLGSGVGERVLVAQGSVAAAWFPGMAPPIDALIVGSIDVPAEEARPSKRASPAPRARAQKKGA